MPASTHIGAAEFRPLARATAAHSTATLNDTSSARFNHSTGVNALLGAPLVGRTAACAAASAIDQPRQRRASSPP